MQDNHRTLPKNQLSDHIDSPHDREEIEKEKVEVTLPDVEDIPGQENFTPAPLGEMADTTISSDDEEGVGIFEENIDQEISEDPDSVVSPTEKKDLSTSANDMPGDDQNLRRAALDDTDEDGTPLNEESFNKNVTASDLDLPGTELDDENESIGEEDEENNDYSLGAGNDKTPRDKF
jgi:hypothetical protein